MNARSTPRVVQVMDAAVSRFANSAKLKFRGRKLSNEAFINAAVLALCALDEATQEAHLRAALGQLEVILEATPDEVRPPRPIVEQAEGVDLTPRPPKRKRGIA